MENTPTPIVTRFAPSPTGLLHVGAVRTALFAYLFARKHKGTFLLRIEDTDKKREFPGAVQQIIDSLTFLGIDYDFGPDKPSPVFGSLIQSERLPIYHKYALELAEKGLAYVDNYTDEEVESFRLKADEEKRPFLFRDHRPEVLNHTWSVGKSLRFKVHEVKKTIWTDAVRGELEAGEEALDDFILMKEDGYPTYNFCHIIDDIEMKVTHVMRGQEFISSVPKFLSLYAALEIIPPVFVTLPPVLGETGGKKLSKRDGAKSALDYLDDGYLSAALFNFLAFLGWNPGGEREIYTQKELTEIFNLNQIQKSGARFNPEKLDWYNKEYMKTLSAEEIEVNILSYFKKENYSEEIYGRIIRMTPIARERAVTFTSYHNDFITGEYDYLINAPNYDSVSLVWKKGTREKTKIILDLLLTIAKSSLDDAEVLEKIKELAVKEGNGDVLWPLRVALSGKEKSPDPYTLLHVLGKTETALRLTNAINSLTNADNVVN